MDRVRYASLPDVSPLDLLIKQRENPGLLARPRSGRRRKPRCAVICPKFSSSLGPIAARNPASVRSGRTGARAAVHVNTSRWTGPETRRLMAKVCRLKAMVRASRQVAWSM